MGGSARTHRIPGSQYIDGAWSTGSGATCEVIDPATETLLADLPSSTDDDVERALRAAREAQTTWALTPPVARGKHLRAIADPSAEHKPRLAALLVDEVGKPAAQAEWDRRLEGEILAGDTPGEVIHLLRAPIGVVSAMVSFTDHRDTGKEIMAMAAGNLTRVALELGGKAPAIVWNDADLELAVSAITEARHTNCGQVCTSAERVLAHRDVLEELSERYVSAAQLAKTESAVALAVDEGAQLLTRGRS